MDDKVIEPDGKTQTVRHIARSGGAVANARKRAREAAVVAKQSRAQVAVALLLSLWLAACRRANRTPIRPDDGKGPASRCVVTTATGPMHASLLDVAAAGADGLFFATLPDGASSSTEAEIFYAALAGAPERKGKGQLDCSYLPCLVHTAEGLYVSAWTDELPVVLRFRDAWEALSLPPWVLRVKGMVASAGTVHFAGAQTLRVGLRPGTAIVPLREPTQSILTDLDSDLVAASGYFLWRDLDKIMRVSVSGGPQAALFEGLSYGTVHHMCATRAHVAFSDGLELRALAVSSVQSSPTPFSVQLRSEFAFACDRVSDVITYVDTDGRLNTLDLATTMRAPRVRTHLPSPKGVGPGARLTMAGGTIYGVWRQSDFVQVTRIVCST
ncbi:MAG: hypothetical protein IPJ34_26460 [Myxococcales bacterium]|nr:hypothetical protein [Myxococcales bacterium]